ncbi:hypothetical protein MFLO_07067 [Listeria floridensis FSL S10-1187]|uniref:Secreted protein n=1 Tax=Listeria floridensis FSL S10-1187 TaxID=1265817 RepID=A0ABP3AZR4_9LIST|nr:hypothetical protein [Listeria floridensis]EUJ32288.1 hypothetical protein MFLO_07067 [Listeria floridensis FSL S10-1187]
MNVAALLVFFTLILCINKDTISVLISWRSFPKSEESGFFSQNSHRIIDSLIPWSVTAWKRNFRIRLTIKKGGIFVHEKE